MSVLTASGICKSKTVLETAVTECVDDTKGTLGVYPRVVNVKSPGKNRIPLRIFNMTAKVVYLKPKSTICGLNEVKVMRHTDLGKADKYASDLESKESNTGSILKKTLILT